MVLEAKGRLNISLSAGGLFCAFASQTACSG